MSCAGDGAGRHTELWRMIAWELGDTYADAMCYFCDESERPKEAAAELEAVARLGGREALLSWWDSKGRARLAFPELRLHEVRP